MMINTHVVMVPPPAPFFLDHPSVASEYYQKTIRWPEKKRAALMTPPGSRDRYELAV
jgi:hypothetical protein